MAAKANYLVLYTLTQVFLTDLQTYDSEIYHTAGFFRGRKLSRISHFGGDSRKFSPRKSIFKQLDTVLVGVVHLLPTNS